MSHFISGDRIAFDTETTGLFPYHGDTPFAFSFCNEEGETAYFEFPVDPFTREPAADPEALDQIAALLEDPSVEKIMHNRKFDQRMMEVRYGIKMQGTTHDTMFMAHCCDSMELTYELKPLCNLYAGIPANDAKELQQAVLRARRVGKKMGWKLGFEFKEKVDGVIKKEAVVAADYWMPAVVKRLHSDMVRVDGDEKLCELYARQDAVRAMCLFLFYKDLIDELDVRDTYEREQSLYPHIYKTEGRGVCVNPPKLQSEIKMCVDKAKNELAEVRAHAWPEFNVNSHPQLRRLLYEKLQLPVLRRTDKTKQPSTDTDALNDHKKHPVVFHIMKYRSAAKAFGYFVAYRRYMQPDSISPNLMSIKADFQQMGPSTGRLACRTPNLMQVTSIESSRSADPIDVRHVFLPRKGYVWLHIDYKGMEIRVYAYCSQEPKMLATIAEGKEIHDLVTNHGWGGKDNPAGIQECIHVLGLDGSELGSNPELRNLWNEWGIKDWRLLTQQDRVDLSTDFLQRFNWDLVAAQKSIGKKVTRNKAKMVFFAKIYGGGPEAITDLLHVEFWEAARFLNFYDEVFPGMSIYKLELENEARINGHIRNLWNRRLTIRPTHVYQCVNYMVQGSSADLLKSAYIRCARFLEESHLDAHVLMPIHDELVFEVAEKDLSYKLVQKLMNLMEDSEGHIGIPMPTDPSYTKVSWHEKHSIRISKGAAA